MTIFRFSGFLLLLLLAGCRGADAAGDARRLGLAFCRAVAGNEDKSAELLMSPPLQARVAALRAADTAYRRANPGEKPPLGDGLRLTAFPDTVATCQPRVETPAQVALTYAPKNDPKGIWQDRLLLGRGADGRPRINDIAYGPDGARHFTDWIAENGGGR